MNTSSIQSPTHALVLNCWNDDKKATALDVRCDHQNPPRQSIPKNHRSWPLATIAGHSVTSGHLVLGLSLSLSIRSLDNLPAQG